MGYAVGGGWRLVAKPCDCCSSAQALLFCRTDSAYLCISCDSKIHATSKLAPKHERVWMCEVCEKAAASVTCKADAAALCVTCDRDIHTANPLSQRHERVPVVPFYETTNSVVKVKSTTDSTYLVPVNNSDILSTCDARDGGGGYVIDEWISPKTIGLDNKPIEFLFSDTENYLEFDYPISSEAQYQHVCRVTDGVVPVQTIKSTVQPQLPVHSSEKHFEIDFTNSHINSYTQSLSQSVSTSSVDIGVVPDGSSMSEISYPFGTSVDMGGGNQAAAPLPLPLIGMDREARVLRYREKRKNRKFEKTIRYASRKAYAETRPRIKGRFAKRTQVDSNVDRMFSLDHLLSFNQ